MLVAVAHTETALVEEVVLEVIAVPLEDLAVVALHFLLKLYLQLVTQ